MSIVDGSYFSNKYSVSISKVDYYPQMASFTIRFGTYIFGIYYAALLRIYNIHEGHTSEGQILTCG